MAITSEDAMGPAEMPTNPAKTAVPEAEPPAEDAASELPEDVLKLPIVNSLLNGAPPAVYAPSEAKIPEVKVIDKYSKELMQSGFAAYGTADGKNKVLFNQLFVTPDEIKAADANGTLIDNLAMSYDTLSSEWDGAKTGSKEETPEKSPKTPSAPAQMPMAASSAADKKLTTARLANLSIGSPTSGPAPGQGRILNSALKPVV